MYARCRYEYVCVYVITPGPAFVAVENQPPGRLGEKKHTYKLRKRGVRQPLGHTHAHTNKSTHMCGFPLVSTHALSPSAARPLNYFLTRSFKSV